MRLELTPDTYTYNKSQTLITEPICPLFISLFDSNKIVTLKYMHTPYRLVLPYQYSCGTDHLHLSPSQTSAGLHHHSSTRRRMTNNI